MLADLRQARRRDLPSVVCCTVVTCAGTDGRCDAKQSDQGRRALLYRRASSPLNTPWFYLPESCASEAVNLLACCTGLACPGCFERVRLRTRLSMQFRRRAPGFRPLPFAPRPCVHTRLTRRQGVYEVYGNHTFAQGAVQLQGRTHGCRLCCPEFVQVGCHRRRTEFGERTQCGCSPRVRGSTLKSQPGGSGYGAIAGGR
jgi:hypothetical protein